MIFCRIRRYLNFLLLSNEISCCQFPHWKKNTQILTFSDENGVYLECQMFTQTESVTFYPFVFCAHQGTWVRTVQFDERLYANDCQSRWIKNYFSFNIVRSISVCKPAMASTPKTQCDFLAWLLNVDNNVNFCAEFESSTKYTLLAHTQ